eukprot:815372-Rhodomonas_salina.2
MASLFDLNKDGKVDENDAYLALEQAEKFYKVVEAKLPLYRPQINIALGDMSRPNKRPEPGERRQEREREREVEERGDAREN